MLRLVDLQFYRDFLRIRVFGKTTKQTLEELSIFLLQSPHALFHTQKSWPYFHLITPYWHPSQTHLLSTLHSYCAVILEIVWSLHCPLTLILHWVSHPQVRLLRLLHCLRDGKGIDKHLVVIVGLNRPSSQRNLFGLHNLLSRNHGLIGETLENLECILEVVCLRLGWDLRWSLPLSLVSHFEGI